MQAVPSTIDDARGLQTDQHDGAIDLLIERLAQRHRWKLSREGNDPVGFLQAALESKK
jgi:hypothetical protein